MKKTKITIELICGSDLQHHFATSFLRNTLYGFIPYFLSKHKKNDITIDFEGTDEQTNS